VIKTLGPEGGDAGTPETIAAEKRSYTGQFLKPVLARAAVSKRKKRVEAAE
jgi:excinuclease ABC subunit A